MEYTSEWKRTKVVEYKPLVTQVIKRSPNKKINVFLFRIEFPSGNNEFHWLAGDLLPLAVNWTQDTTCSFHELILGPWRCFFMDIESSVSDLMPVIHEVKDAIKSVYGETTRVIITAACNDEKSSFHVICPNLVFGNNDELKNGVALVKSEIDNFTLQCAIDMGIYKDKTQMRKYRSYKKGVRPFLLLEDVSDEPQSLADMYVTSPNVFGTEGCTLIGVPKAYVETGTGKSIDPSTVTLLEGLNMPVIAKPGGRVWFVENCPVCGRHHDSDNAKITVYDSGIHVWCFRESMGKFIRVKKARPRIEFDAM